MELPSVWYISGWHIKQEGPLDPETDSESLPPQSRASPNIKMLAFEQSNIDGYAMRDLLSRTHSLRSFVYEVDGNNPYDVPFAPDVMVEALEQYSAHSLEEFQMVVNPDWAAMEPWRHIAPLRAFQKLRIVEVEAESLCREDDEDVTEDLKPLVESMPKTLEALALSLEQSEVLFEGF
jgi:hypothetical protein